MKTYFVKASWTDPEQPLARIHENFDDIVIDSDAGISYQVRKQVFNDPHCVKGFTVDFMIEVS